MEWFSYEDSKPDTIKKRLNDYKEYYKFVRRIKKHGLL